MTSYQIAKILLDHGADAWSALDRTVMTLDRYCLAADGSFRADPIPAPTTKRGLYEWLGY